MESGLSKDYHKISTKIEKSEVKNLRKVRDKINHFYDLRRVNGGIQKKVFFE